MNPTMNAALDHHAQRLVALINAQFNPPDLLLHSARLLADTEEPITVERVAAAGGWSVDAVRAELARHPGVDWDDEGRIVGFGLTLRPTAHAFTFGERTVYGFCASDALMYPVMLGRPGLVESSCPVTGQPIRVELTPNAVVAVQPATAVVSKVRPDQPVTDVRSEICALGSFIASPDDAAGWLAQHPHGEVVPVAEDFEVNRLAMIELDWAAPGIDPARGGRP